MTQHENSGPAADAKTVDVVAETWRRWTWRQLKRAFRWACILLVVLLIAGFCYEQYSLHRRQRELRPPGELIDIGGRSLHMRVLGSGSPVVIFESGAGVDGKIWDDVASEIAKTTTVVTYDRAGFGFSDTNPSANLTSLLSDLKTALAAQDIAGPYVLVGHSLGGLYVRAFAYQNLNDVAGIVLVDSSHEEQTTKLPEAMTNTMNWMITIFPVIRESARFGIPRLLSRQGLEGPSYEFLDAALEEIKQFDDIGAEVKAMQVPLADLPLIVISAGTFQTPFSSVSPEEMRDAWYEMQRELVALSSNADQRIATDSGHNIQIESPAVVVEEVLRMIEAVKTGARIDAE